jgi:hypothetical protein
MAAVLRTSVMLVSPAGSEYVDRGLLRADVTAGQPLTDSSTGYGPTTKAATSFDAIALQDGKSGTTIDIMYQGEIRGVTNTDGSLITPGTAIYVDATTDGELGTTAPTGGIVQAKAKAKGLLYVSCI